MLQRNFLTAISLAVLLGVNLSATADTGIRKYAGEFMSIDVSARAQALGGAFSALSNDVFASFYNPAGLVQVQSLQIGFTHTQQFLKSVNYDYLGFVHPLSDETAFGVSLIRLGVDNIKDSRTAAILDENGVLQGIDESQLENFNSSDYVFFVSFGKRFKSKLSWGFNVKLVRRNLANNSANGIGLDAGLLYAVTNRWKISTSFRNITTTLISWESGEKELVSPTLRLGSSYQITFPALDSYLVPVVDLILQTQSTPNLTESSFNSGYFNGAFGGEFVVKNRLFLRGGYDDLQRLNLGVGVKIPHFQVDYSFTNFDQELDNAHRIGILVDFGN